nr:MAG TPA: hypothetical protein [Caudoviricetes sp.]DAS54804.1 MAG TPA: hypothetical protein [Caudoviricetes sp.]
MAGVESPLFLCVENEMLSNQKTRSPLCNLNF